MGTANADVVRRVSDEVFLKGDLQAIDDLLAEDFLSHERPGGLPGTREGYRDLARIVVGALSDRRMEFEELIDTADGRVVQSWAMVASHTGDFFGLPPSGETVRIRGVDIFRIENGKMAERWGAVDASDVVAKAQAGPGS
jgi:steroid delta-isomerase-like uncharacterized protein